MVLMVGLILISTPVVGTQAPLNVIASTPDLASIAESVGGDRITVRSLARGTEDPHHVHARPSFIRLLHEADALVHGGAGLEWGWLYPLIQSSRNNRILPGRPGLIGAGAGVELVDVATGLPAGIRQSGNPHFLLDPRNAKIVAANLAERLAVLDPDGRSAFEKNALLFKEEIDRRMEGWRTTLAPYEGTRVVTYHRNYDYFARAFGLIVHDTLEPLPGIEPTPRHLAALIPSMKEHRVRLIVMEPFRSARAAERVANETGAVIVRLPELVGGAPEIDDYFALIDYNVRQVSRALENLSP